MNRNLQLAALLAAITLGITGCTGVPRATFYRAPNFNPDSSIKVITLNTNDVLSGRLEHFLLLNNFTVISDNTFRLPASTAFPTPIFPGDTSLYRPGQMVVNIPYMEERPSDYILRYQFDNAADSRGRSSMYLAVVNTKTGQTEISFLNEQAGRLDQLQIDRLIRDFIIRMKR